MLDRRVFVVSVGTGLVALGPRGAAGQSAIQVTAVPTLFHGHPDGATTLVRFEATGVDAPAGRLRVHDLRTGRQLGTAGTIRRGDRLTGELWLPLAAPTRVRSDLEAPGRRIRSARFISSRPHPAGGSSGPRSRPRTWSGTRSPIRFLRPPRSTAEN